MLTSILLSSKAYTSPSFRGLLWEVEKLSAIFLVYKSNFNSANKNRKDFRKTEKIVCLKSASTTLEISFDITR